MNELTSVTEALKPSGHISQELDDEYGSLRSFRNYFLSKQAEWIKIFDKEEAFDFPHDFSKQFDEYRMMNSRIVELFDKSYESNLRAKDLVQELSKLKDFDEIIEANELVVTSYEKQKTIREGKDALSNILGLLAFMQASFQENLMKSNNEWEEFDSDTLGPLERVDSFPSGSIEWLKERQKGIGGSDVAAIIGAKSGSGRLNKSKKTLLKDKIETVTKSQHEQSGAERFFGPTGRGDAWERWILVQQMEKHPHHVAYCKDSFRVSKNHDFHANFDGLELNDNKMPCGVIEIKTASSTKGWGLQKDGADGVPGNYRAQVLHYMFCAGFSKGRICVVFNYSGDVLEYNFDFDKNPELKEEAERNARLSGEFMNKVCESREGEEHYTAKKIFCFPKVAYKNNDKGEENREAIFEEIAAYRGTDKAIIKKEFEDYGHSIDDEKTHEVFHELYQKNSKHDGEWTKRLASIDLETNGYYPSVGRIIQLGLIIEDLETGKIINIDKTFDIPDSAKNCEEAYGSTDIHHIDKESTKGLETFNDYEETGTLRRILLQPSTLILAHNSRFEKVFLSRYMHGFKKSLDKGIVRLLDTMSLSKRVEHVTDDYGNTVNAYAFRYHVYDNLDEEQHNAFQDALDTLKAFKEQRRIVKGLS